MGQGPVEIHIERLVLRGVRPADGVELAPLVEAALAEALAGVALDPAALAAAARQGTLQAPPIRLSGATPAAGLAPQIALSLKGGLTR
jgi:hypothetical protein